ncbi:MAG: VWA domain-containing protein, partial [bacterium]|nr:VWA domain-containing protein [bacterium]
LPAADEDDMHGPSRPFAWLENSISGLASLVIHCALLILAALWTYGAVGGPGEGENVFIGALPGETLSNEQEAAMSAADEVAHESPDEFEDTLDIEVDISATADDVATLDALSPSMAASGGASGGAIGDFSSISTGGLSGGDGSWDGMIQDLKRNGLDIVIVFDSTGSMGGEINEVKSQIRRIGTALRGLIPKTRLGLVTYVDFSDRPDPAWGTPLTRDIQELEAWMAGVRASGGGDHPEAVQEGLKWAVENNQFSPRAKKVILLFGDAPPHDADLESCLKTAADFSAQQDGFVSTVTCRSPIQLDEFNKIARAGGGESFLTTDEREIMTQLLVLVFGSRYRSKVLDAFELLEK